MTKLLLTLLMIATGQLIISCVGDKSKPVYGHLSPGADLPELAQQYSDAYDQAAKDAGSDQIEQSETATIFNPDANALSFVEKFKQDGCLAKYSTSYMKRTLGFNQKLCDAKVGQKDDSEQKSARTNYRRLQQDLNNLQQMGKIIREGIAFESIKTHQDALRSVPIAIAKKSYMETMGVGNKEKIFVPKGSEGVMKEIVHKFDQLKKIKAAVNDPSVSNKKLLAQIKEYEKLRISRSKIEGLRKAGVKFKNIKGVQVENILNSKLKALKRYAQVRTTTVSKAASNRDRDAIRARDALNHSFKKLKGVVSQTLHQAGVVEDVDLERIDNMDRVINRIEGLEGWNFYPEDKVALYDFTIPQEKKAPFMQRCFDHLKKSGDAVQKAATSFFGSYANYDQQSGNDFEKKFHQKVDQLEREMQVNPESPFRKWKDSICQGIKRSPKFNYLLFLLPGGSAIAPAKYVADQAKIDSAKCNLSDVFSSFNAVQNEKAGKHRAKGVGDILAKFGKWIGIKDSDKLDSAALLAMAEDRLRLIQGASQCLALKYGTACSKGVKSTSISTGPRAAKPVDISAPDDSSGTAVETK
jgi:hypothetical protein